MVFMARVRTGLFSLSSQCFRGLSNKFEWRLFWSLGIPLDCDYNYRLSQYIMIWKLGSLLISKEGRLLLITNFYLPSSGTPLWEIYARGSYRRSISWWGIGLSQVKWGWYWFPSAFKKHSQMLWLSLDLSKAGETAKSENLEKGPKKML